VNPKPAEGESDIRVVADRVFLERATPTTLELYQRVMNNVLNRTGAVLDSVAYAQDGEYRIVIGFRYVQRPLRLTGRSPWLMRRRARVPPAAAPHSATFRRCRTCTTTTTSTRPANTSVRCSFLLSTCTRRDRRTRGTRAFALRAKGGGAGGSPTVGGCGRTEMFSNDVVILSVYLKRAGNSDTAPAIEDAIPQVKREASLLYCLPSTPFRGLFQANKLSGTVPQVRTHTHAHESSGLLLCGV
jgi:hypothetical protein